MMRRHRYVVAFA